MPSTQDPFAPDPFLDLMARPARQEVTVAGRSLHPGDRVRLRPRKGGDIIDIALGGRIAIIEGIDEDEAGATLVAVVVEDDPGRDLGVARNPAHRFFFAPWELEPVDAPEEGKGHGTGDLCKSCDGRKVAEACELCEGHAGRRVLVAGIGNIFHGDDGFGVAVAGELARRSLPAGVEVKDYGIRGMDLAYALGDGYHAAILVDVVPRGCAPGTVCVIEPEAEFEAGGALDSHQMNPLAVLSLARTLGPLPGHLIIVGCEPDPATGSDLMSMELTAPVAAAVGRAADVIAELAGRLVTGSGMDSAAS